MRARMRRVRAACMRRACVRRACGVCVRAASVLDAHGVVCVLRAALHVRLEAAKTCHLDRTFLRIFRFVKAFSV